MARRKPRVLIVGLPYFGRMLESVLRARGWDATYAAHPGRNPLGWLALVPKLLRADLLYFIGTRVDRRSPQAMLMRLWRRPALVHWVGTDVLIALDEHRAGRAARTIRRKPVHWCDAPWLAAELAEMGVHADYVPLPAVGLASGDPPPLPERFRVLLYLPVDDFDREVFDIATLLRLPAALPEAAFTLVPSPPETLPGPLPPNLEARPWVHDMDALYRETTVLVRLTSHDGTSFMVLEALSRGRYAIWPFPMPGAVRARGFDEVKAVLGALLERHRRGSLGLNESGMRAIRKEFDREQLEAQLDSRLRDILRAHRRKKRAAK
ncbi:MAG: hypothetical protein ACM3S1_16465 [Hyphomicrobiales bacterium]